MGRYKGIDSKYLGYVRPFSQRGYEPHNKEDLKIVKERESVDYNEYLKSVRAEEFAAGIRG